MFPGPELSSASAQDSRRPAPKRRGTKGCPPRRTPPNVRDRNAHGETHAEWEGTEQLCWLVGWFNNTETFENLPPSSLLLRGAPQNGPQQCSRRPPDTRGS